MKKLITTLLLIFSLLFLPNPILAQSPSPEPQVETVDVYALFWPIVPGKTAADPMFFLKQLKESFDGFFKSGEIAQSEYQMELSQKRLVEANKLVDDKDYGNAKKSLEMNKSNRHKAVELKRKALEKNLEIGELTPKLVESLEKQQKALDFLITQFPADQQAEVTETIGDLTLQISEAK